MGPFQIRAPHPREQPSSERGRDAKGVGEACCREQGAEVRATMQASPIEKLPLAEETQLLCSPPRSVVLRLLQNMVSLHLLIY